jgi:hypothetical protein
MLPPFNVKVPDCTYTPPPLQEEPTTLLLLILPPFIVKEPDPT